MCESDWNEIREKVDEVCNIGGKRGGEIDARSVRRWEPRGDEATQNRASD